VREAEADTPRPAPRATPQAAPSRPSPAQQAAGRGGGAERGSAAVAGSAAEAAQRRLMAEWGAAIRAHLLRRAPARGVGRGTVTLALSVARDGRLLEAGVAASSGDPGLDRAALLAVRGAGRLPAAPAALGGASHRFSLPLRFD
jgi:protein TonB